VEGIHIVNKKTTSAIGLALLLLLSYLCLCWSDSQTNTLPVVPQVTSETGESSKVEQAPEVVASPEETRKNVADTVIDTAAIASMAPHEFEMEIHARTVNDLPGGRVRIYLAPEFHALNQTRTNREGVARVKWRARVATMTMVYASPRGLEGGKRLHRLVVHAGTVARVAVRVKAKSGRGGPVLVFGNGRRLQLSSSALSGGRFRLSQVTISNGPGVPPSLHADKDGWSWFTTGRSRLLGQTETRSVVGRNQSFVLSGLDIQMVQGGRSNRETLLKRVLSGIVRDAVGRRVPAALVLLAGKWRARTNDKGVYRIEFKQRNGESLQARAGGGDHGIAQGKIEVGEATELTWNPQLDRGTELRGQLMTPDGKPRAGWHIEIEPEDASPFIDGTKTDAEGRFSVPNVIDRPYRLRAFASKSVLPSLQKNDVRPNVDQVMVIQAEEKPGFLQVTPRDLDGKLVADAELRLWDDRTGVGFRHQGSHEKQSVVSGLYRLVLGAPGFELKDHTQVSIDADQVNNLGDVMMGDRAMLDTASAMKEISLYWMHDAVPSCIDTAGKKTVWLPPGNYRAFHGADEIAFEVRPGANQVPVPIRRQD